VSPRLPGLGRPFRPGAGDPLRAVRQVVRQGLTDGAPGPVVLVGGSPAAVEQAMGSLAASAERPLYRLELTQLAGTADVAPALRRLLDAAVVAGAVVGIDAADVLLPAPPGPGETSSRPADLAALAVDDLLSRHPLPVVVGATDRAGVHPTLTRRLAGTARLD
jgi:hypothetical protein